jgi:hypothetical protein
VLLSSLFCSGDGGDMFLGTFGISLNYKTL